jgi:hypothetical protein
LFITFLVFLFIWFLLIKLFQFERTKWKKIC